MLLRSPGPDQSRHVERAHLSPCLVTQPIQKRLEPTAKARLSNPTFCEPWSAPPKSRPPMSHRKSDLGIPCPRKICQSSASLEEIMRGKMQRAHPPLSLIKKRRRTRLATILICGSPADGFQIIGLFADRDDAQSYAEDYSLKDWWIAELTSPDAFAEMQRQRFRALRGPH